LVGWEEGRFGRWAGVVMLLLLLLVYMGLVELLWLVTRSCAVGR